MHAYKRKNPVYARIWYSPRFRAPTEEAGTCSPGIEGDHCNWMKVSGGFHQAMKSRRFLLADRSAGTKTGRLDAYGLGKSLGKGEGRDQNPKGLILQPAVGPSEALGKCAECSDL